MRMFLIILYTLLGSFTCSAQSFNAKDLVGTKWVRISNQDPEKDVTIEFTATNIIRTFTYKSSGGTFVLTDSYYLSATIPSEFEEHNVGKNMTGKYFVYHVSKRDFWNYYTIIEFTDTYLAFHHRKLPGAIGSKEYVDRYKRIK